MNHSLERGPLLCRCGTRDGPFYRVVETTTELGRDLEMAQIDKTVGGLRPPRPAVASATRCSRSTRARCRRASTRASSCRSFASPDRARFEIAKRACCVFLEKMKQGTSSFETVKRRPVSKLSRVVSHSLKARAGANPRYMNSSVDACFWRQRPTEGDCESAHYKDRPGASVEWTVASRASASCLF